MGGCPVAPAEKGKACQGGAQEDRDRQGEAVPAERTSWWKSKRKRELGASGQLGGIAHCSETPGRRRTKKLALEGDRVEGRDAQKRDARARWVMGLNYWALRRHLRGESEVP